MTKSKYEAGDEVLVRARVLTVFDKDSYSHEDNLYSLEVLPDREVDVEVYEKDIVGKAELIEPTKLGTVVILHGKAYQLASPEFGTPPWFCTFDGNVRRSWEELCKLGTPKIIWEPEK